MKHNLKFLNELAFTLTNTKTTLVELYVLHTSELRLKICTLHNCNLIPRMRMVVQDTSWRWWSYCSSRKRCCCCCHFVRWSTYKLEYLILALLSHFERILCKYQLNKCKKMILYQPTLSPGRNACEASKKVKGEMLLTNCGMTLK